jgi:hypothetical protein
VDVDELIKLPVGSRVRYRDSGEEGVVTKQTFEDKIIRWSGSPDPTTAEEIAVEKMAEPGKLVIVSDGPQG